jgi:hypothetical protein
LTAVKLADSDAFWFDIGKASGFSGYKPEYIQVRKSLLKKDKEDRLVASPFVTQHPARVIKPNKGATVLADAVLPYFNRELKQFCSHQHFPDAKKGGPAAFINKSGNILYFANPIFTAYADSGQMLIRDFVALALEQLAGEPSIVTSLPSAGRVSLMEQKKQKRSVLHLLYCQPIKRGGNVMEAWSIKDVEVVEDIVPVHHVCVRVRTARKIKAVQHALSGKPIVADISKDGKTANFVVPKVNLHELIVLRH